MYRFEEETSRLRPLLRLAVGAAVILMLVTSAAFTIAEPPSVIGRPTPVQNLVWQSHSAGLITTGKFNGLGQWMFTVGGGNVLKACELNQLVRLPNHSNSLATGGRPALIVVGTNVGTVELYDEQTLRLKKRFKVGPEYSVYAVAIDADVKRVAACGTDGSVLVWNIDTDRPIHHLKTGSREGERMAALAFSPDDKSLATLSRYGFLTLWDLASGQPIGTPVDHRGGEQSTLQFSPASDRVAVVDRAVLRIWHPIHEPVVRVIIPPESVCPRYTDAENSRPGIRPDFGNGIRFAGVTTLSQDLKRAATVVESGGIAIWDIASLKVLSTLPPSESAAKREHPGSEVDHIAFSPDQSKLAASTVSGELAVWQIK